MIDPKDLMLGNWVYDGERTQFPMFVRAVGEDYVYLDFEGNEGDIWEARPEDIQGIPLSKDIFIRLGLETFNNIFYKPGTEFEVFGNEHDGWLLSANYVEYTLMDTPIRYVHELQNLYYLITKQTLKINL